MARRRLVRAATPRPRWSGSWNSSSNTPCNGPTTRSASSHSASAERPSSAPGCATCSRGGPDLATFFDEEAEVGRRFFVKNLENVQGDERDAIILSVGGSRNATGALNHNFGPINQKGAVMK